MLCAQCSARSFTADTDTAAPHRSSRAQNSQQEIKGYLSMHTIDGGSPVIK